LYHAKLVDTEEGWRSVIRYFPEASVYCHNLARQGLAYHYLHSHEYEKAIGPLEELTAQSPDFQSFGIAGLVVAYANLGDDEKALDENGRLSVDARKSLGQQSPQMYELLRKTIDELIDRTL
jgi:hypothetical protein